jgi:hypothetical protein
MNGERKKIAVGLVCLKTHRFASVVGFCRFMECCLSFRLMKEYLFEADLRKNWSLVVHCLSSVEASGTNLWNII